jgi:hypothetical protein
MCDELADEDLVIVGDNAALSSSIRLKLSDAWAVHLGLQVVCILGMMSSHD